MTRYSVLLSLLLLLSLFSHATARSPTQSNATPELHLAWETNGLHVQWSAPEAGCLVLSGGPPDQLLDLPCAASGDVRLLSGGVDQAYAPQRYARVELRRQTDLRDLLARAAIPPRYTIWLPSVAAK